MASRADSLRSEHRLDSLLSREAVFLLNNLLLVALCFVIFWGTFFPLIAEAATGRQRNIGPPVYEAFVVPLALLLVLAAGVGPLIAWRRATAANLRRNLARPAACGLAVLVVLIALGQTRSVTALIMFALAGLRLRRRRARTSGAACARGARSRASRCRRRSSRSSGATGAATAATSRTSGSSRCSSASRPPRASRTSRTCR